MKKWPILLLILITASLWAAPKLRLASGDITPEAVKTSFPAAGGRVLALAVARPGTDARFFLREGAAVLGYVPDGGYLLWLNRDQWGRLQKAPELLSLGAFRTEWKRGPIREGNRFMALVVTPGPAPRLESRRISLAPDQIGAALARPDVVWLESEGTLTLRNDTTSWVLQSNVQDLRPIYDQGLHGEGEIVGHIDGPIWVDSCYFYDPDHPIGPDHRKIVAYRSSTGNGKDAHGTHTAGTVCGQADGQPDNGIAYNARLSFSNVYDITGSGTETSNLYDYFMLAHQDGAHLHTNSWGDDSTMAYTTWSYDIDRYSYDVPEDLVFFAIANSPQSPTITTPENAKNVMAVGGALQAPQQDRHCTGGKGPTRDGRLKPDIYAPGCGILSASTQQVCGIANMSGTSMASPAATASGALVRQYFREGFYPSFIEGWGRPELDKTLVFVGSTRKLWIQDVKREDGVEAGGMQEFHFSLESSDQPLKITLAFADYPAIPNASYTPVNDLDLEVTAPDGTVYLGNVITNGASLPGGAADPLNTVEEVILPVPLEGAYSVRVKGTAVPMPPQGFALTGTGDLGNNLRYYLPVVARAPGGGGSLWTTDLWLFNPSPDPQRAFFTFVMSGVGGSVTTVPVDLAGLEARYLADPLKDLFGVDQGFGAGLMEAQEPLQIGVRIANVASGASFGQAYTASSEIIRDGETVYLPGLFAGGGRRTNIGFANFGLTGASLELNLYDALGSLVDHEILGLDSGSYAHRQNTFEEVFPTAGSLQAGTLSVQVHGGGAAVAAYASVITSSTGDGIFIGAQKEPAGDMLIPVLASSSNPTGYPWKTELTLFSPEGGTFSGAFRVNTGSGWDSLQVDATLPAEGTSHDDDFMESLGLTFGVGYLTYAGPFIPSTRIWSGADIASSMGQYIDTLPMSRAAAHHWLPGNVPTAGYRMNLGLINTGAADILCQLVLWDAMHNQLGATTMGAPAQSLIQQGALALVGNLPTGMGGVLELSCSGDLFTYVSLVDNTTSDATLFIR